MSCAELGAISAELSFNTINTKTATLMAMSSAVAFCHSGRGVSKVAGAEERLGAPLLSSCFRTTGWGIALCTLRHDSHWSDFVPKLNEGSGAPHVRQFAKRFSVVPTLR